MILEIIFYKFWVFYLSPTNFNYWWNFGSIALIFICLNLYAMFFIKLFFKFFFDFVFQINIIFFWLKFIKNNIEGKIQKKAYTEVNIDDLLKMDNFNMYIFIEKEEDNSKIIRLMKKQIFFLLNEQQKRQLIENEKENLYKLMWLFNKFLYISYWWYYYNFLKRKNNNINIKCFNLVNVVFEKNFKRIYLVNFANNKNLFETTVFSSNQKLTTMEIYKDNETQEIWYCNKEIIIFTFAYDWNIIDILKGFEEYKKTNKLYDQIEQSYFNYVRKQQFIYGFDSKLNVCKIMLEYLIFYKFLQKTDFNEWIKKEIQIQEEIKNPQQLNNNLLQIVSSKEDKDIVIDEDKFINKLKSIIIHDNDYIEFMLPNGNFEIVCLDIYNFAELINSIYTLFFLDIVYEFIFYEQLNEQDRLKLKQLIVSRKEKIKNLFYYLFDEIDTYKEYLYKDFFLSMQLMNLPLGSWTDISYDKPINVNIFKNTLVYYYANSKPINEYYVKLLKYKFIKLTNLINDIKIFDKQVLNSFINSNELLLLEINKNNVIKNNITIDLYKKYINFFHLKLLELSSIFKEYNDKLNIKQNFLMLEVNCKFSDSSLGIEEKNIFYLNIANDAKVTDIIFNF